MLGGYFTYILSLQMVADQALIILMFFRLRFGVTERIGLVPKMFYSELGVNKDHGLLAKTTI
jgi:hypothetical protein